MKLQNMHAEMLNCVVLCCVGYGSPWVFGTRSGWVWEDFRTRGRVRGWERVCAHGHGFGELIPGGEFPITLALTDAIFYKNSSNDYRTRSLRS
jgi:hypothetical protein